MSRISQLLDNYATHIAIPWRSDAAASQRVIFCVYPETQELRLRAQLEEFGTRTRDAGHAWAHFDLTDSFPDWLGPQKYAKSYFKDPTKLGTLLPKYEDFIVEQFTLFCTDAKVTEETVVAVSGVGTLFGFRKVKGVVDRLAPLVPGRLVLFFPGLYEDNNYRLLDSYDGWDYLALPITADQ